VPSVADSCELYAYFQLSILCGVLFNVVLFLITGALIFRILCRNRKKNAAGTKVPLDAKSMSILGIAVGFNLYSIIYFLVNYCTLQWL